MTVKNKMKNTGNSKFSAHMVRNSKPVGRSFKRKNFKSNTNFQNTKPKLKDINELGSSGLNTLQKPKDKKNGRVELGKNKNDSIHIAKNSNVMTKQKRLPKNGENGDLLLENKDKMLNLEGAKQLPTTKRKFDDEEAVMLIQKRPKKSTHTFFDDEEAAMSIQKRPKKSKHNLKTKEKKQSDNNHSGAELKAAVENAVKPKKKKRKKKKKKLDGDADNTQYKPVLFLKGEKDISANWKNLKEIITKCDKENAAKKKEAERKWQISKLHKSSVAHKKEDIKIENRNWKESKLKNTNEKQGKKYKELKKKREEIWFDNVDPILLGEEYEEEDNESSKDNDNKTEADGTEEEKKNVVKKNVVKKKVSTENKVKAVAVDCEMVGVGINGKESVLARVSIVDQYCQVLYNKYVKPQEPVVDYRTEFSGIRPEDIKDGHDFKTVQSEVAKILEGKILVGHGLRNDLRVLFLQHPRSRIRDTARYKPFKTMFRGNTPKLKMLAKKFLGVGIQTGEHDSIQDAQATMRIYLIHHKEWNKAKEKVFDKSKKKKVKKEETPLL